MVKVFTHSPSACIALLACSFNIWLQSSFTASASPKTERYPDLDGALFAGHDFDGREYELKFQTSKGYKETPYVQPPSQGIDAGEVLITTRPSQSFKSCHFLFIGPQELGNHGQQTGRYQMKFAFYGPQAFTDLDAVLVDNKEIEFDTVHPLIFFIDYKALLGDRVLKIQAEGFVANCAGQNVNFRVECFRDYGIPTREMEIQMDQGATPSRGPNELGDQCYFQPVWSEPSFVPNLYVLRANVLIVAGCGEPMKSPEVKKEMIETAKLLDQAIRDENSALTTLTLPKHLVRN